MSRHPSMRRFIAGASLCLPATLALSSCNGATGSAPDESGVDSPSYLQSEYPAEYEAQTQTLTGSMIARGDSLYHGATGNVTCILCHSPLLIGGSRGTKLRDAHWHHADGTYASILGVIVGGVEQAVASPIPAMPPMGGVELPMEDVEALAAFVYWFSRTHAASDSVEYPGGHEHQEVSTEGGGGP